MKIEDIICAVVEGIFDGLTTVFFFLLATAICRYLELGDVLTWLVAAGGAWASFAITRRARK